ncbi:unnamed protein product [Pleuronectes platessa]|uniref:Plus3 domain-containing protein n=1 Tax=Pleuronectes platessa TaxID=8262 RepID=A0A9N7UK81_PLEPL|nr:unnamed protein product [Pleuronectes platessa]
MSMMVAGMKVPEPQMIASKEKLVKKALDRPFTQGEYDVMVVAMSKLSTSSAARSQVEHGKGPEEKKACGEVTQPAHPFDELKRICLPFNRLQKWCHMPFFATNVKGCFVRVATEASISDPPYCVAEIVSVMVETKNEHQFGSKRPNLVFKLRLAGQEKIVPLSSISNEGITISEFNEWKLSMKAALMKVPTPQMIATKEKLVKIALDRHFTQGEYDVMVGAMSKLSLASAARSHRDADMVERKFLVGGAASASGRSAGTKWKRQVQHGEGPEEKRACGEMTQPALPPASAVSGRSAGTKCKRQDEQETSEMISSKRRKCIKEALDNAFTQDEFDFFVAQKKKRFREAP